MKYINIYSYKSKMEHKWTLKLATKIEIKKWWFIGKKEESTHMIIVYNQREGYDFPVYIKENDHVKDIYESFAKDSKYYILSVFSFNRKIIDQLNEVKTIHFD